MFTVDPAFAIGATPLASLGLSEIWLQRDARFPWLILIPRTAAAVELEDLSRDDRHRLVDEIVLAGTAVRAIGLGLGRPISKLNVGALGNITPQLHIHVVGRRPDDAAWPDPVWGRGQARLYDTAALDVARTAAWLVLTRA
jgi:diadenosine tetraphosphate (Ap4A) HIT family hydrolase